MAYRPETCEDRDFLCCDMFPEGELPAAIRATVTTDADEFDVWYSWHVAQYDRIRTIEQGE